jgi:hypothetical protein
MVLDKATSQVFIILLATYVGPCLLLQESHIDVIHLATN